MKILCSLIRGLLYIALFLLWAGTALGLPQLAGWITEPGIWSILAPVGVGLALLWPVSKLFSIINRYVRPREGRLEQKWKNRQRVAKKKKLFSKASAIVRELGDGESYEKEYQGGTLRIVRNDRYRKTPGVRHAPGQARYGYEVIWDGQTVFHQLRDEDGSTLPIMNSTIEVYHRGFWEKHLKQLYQQAITQQSKRKQAEEDATPNRTEALKQKLGE